MPQKEQEKIEKNFADGKTESEREYPCSNSIPCPSHRIS